MTKIRLTEVLLEVLGLVQEWYSTSCIPDSDQDSTPGPAEAGPNMSDLPDLAPEGREVPGQDTIRVVCRFRPLNQSEEKSGSKFVVQFPAGSDDQSVSIGVSIRTLDRFRCGLYFVQGNVNKLATLNLYISAWLNRGVLS